MSSIIRVESMSELGTLTDKAVSSSLIFYTLMMEVIRSSKTSVLTRTTRRHIPEDGNLHEDSGLAKILYILNFIYSS
jgi:hypothetical protein